MTPEVRSAVATALRPISAADLPACADVFYTALDQLTERHGEPRPPRNHAGMVTFFGQLLASDPDLAWLAVGPDGVDGFAFAHLRERAWFLAFLYVRPAVQGQGIGRRLLLASFPHDPALCADDGRGGASAWDGVLATCADSIQPISTALYGGYGLVPRVPLFTMLGRARAGVLPALPESLERVGFDAIAGAGPSGHRNLVELVAELDRQAVGYARPEDHRSWRLADRRGWAFRDRGSGEVLGYGYAQPSGRLGPVALRDGELLPAVLGELMATLQPAGDWQVFVPGVADRAMTGLLRAGFRYDGTPAMYCSSRPGPDFSRYVVASYALL